MAKKARKKRAKKPTGGDAIVSAWLAVAKQRGMTVAAPAGKKTGAALWKLLEDPNPSVRQAAGFALTAVRDPALVQAFILGLKGTSSQRVARAVVTLGEAGFSNAGPYFMAAFAKKDRTMSPAMARALGLLSQGEATGMLADALDANFVPAEAAEALGRLNNPDGVPALVRALGHSSDVVRSVAAYALGCMGGLSVEQERTVAQRLGTLRTDKSQRVRLCAAVARYERGDPEGLEAIRSALS